MESLNVSTIYHCYLINVINNNLPVYCKWVDVKYVIKKIGSVFVNNISGK